MKLLYVFPHPDDESFGPAPVLFEQRSAGHEVYLLTLTKGEATKQRHRYGYSKDEMGAVRERELEQVADLLDLNGLTVLDFPDSGLTECDPLELEAAVAREIQRIKPAIVVTYPVHGNSGFHDHLVTHAVVKRVFRALQSQDHSYLQRLAFYTLFEPVQPPSSSITLEGSAEEAIDCVISVSDAAAEKGREALLCYETYQQVIEETGVLERVHDDVYFEIYREDYTPPLRNLTDEM